MPFYRFLFGREGSPFHWTLSSLGLEAYAYPELAPLFLFRFFGWSLCFPQTRQKRFGFPCFPLFSLFWGPFFGVPLFSTMFLPGSDRFFQPMQEDEEVLVINAWHRLEARQNNFERECSKVPVFSSVPVFQYVTVPMFHCLPAFQCSSLFQCSNVPVF